MPIDSPRPSPRQLLAAAPRADDTRPDRDLHAATRDEEAFAELVRRHGWMVLAVTPPAVAPATPAPPAVGAKRGS